MATAVATQPAEAGQVTGDGDDIGSDRTLNKMGCGCVVAVMLFGLAGVIGGVGLVVLAVTALYRAAAGP